MRRRFTALAVIGLFLIGCSSSAPPATTPVPAPSGTTAPAAPKADADVQKVYDEFVKKHMPKVSIDLLQAAKKEGQVTIYHLVSPPNTPLVQLFRDTFPFLKVDVQQLTGGALFEKFMSESRAGQHNADIVQFSSIPGHARAAHDEGFTLNYAVTVENELPMSEGLAGYILPFIGSPQVMAYNPKKITDEEALLLRKWSGLLDPKLMGKRYAMVDISSGGAAQAYNFALHDGHGTKAWEQIVKSGFALYPGVNPQMDSVVTGETEIAVGGSVTAVISRFNKGAPIRWQYPEPYVVIPFGQIISKNTKHPNAAKLFQEFTMSIPGQDVWVNGGAMSYREGPKDTNKYTQESWFSPPSASKLYKMDLDRMEKDLAAITKIWDGYFKK